MSAESDLASIPRLFQHGVVVRARAVVGCWYTFECKPMRGYGNLRVVEFAGLARTPCGHMAGFADVAEAGTPLAPRAHRLLEESVASVTAQGSVPEHVGQGVGQALHELFPMLGEKWWCGTGLNRSVATVCTTGEDREQALRDTSTALREHLARLVAGIRPFVDTLDPGARDVVRAVFYEGDDGSHQVAGRHYAALDRTFDPAAPLARALRARPEVPRSVLEAWDEGPFDPKDLDATLARRWTARHGLPRRLAMKTPDGYRTFLQMGVNGISGLCEERPDDVDPGLAVLFPLGRFPASWTPATPSEWLASVSLHDVIGEAARLADDRLPLGALLDAGQGWETLGHRLLTASGAKSLHEVQARVADVEDFLQGYVAEVLMPALMTSGFVMPDASPLGLAKRLLLSGRGLPRIIGDSVRWHAGRERLRDALRGMGPGADDPGERWPACYPDHQDGTLVLKVLVDPRSLEDEGASGTDDGGMSGLSHCAGGYAGLCRTGVSRVASLRGDGGRVSTAEFRLDRDGRPTLRQHRGLRNADPPPEASRFLRRYLDLLAEGALPFSPEGLVPDTGHFAGAEPGAYDWNQQGAWEAARDLWAPFVPRRLRGLARGDLARLAVALARAPDRAGLGWRPDPVVPEEWPVL